MLSATARKYSACRSRTSSRPTTRRAARARTRGSCPACRGGRCPTAEPGSSRRATRGGRARRRTPSPPRLSVSCRRTPPAAGTAAARPARAARGSTRSPSAACAGAPGRRARGLRGAAAGRAGRGAPPDRAVRGVPLRARSRAEARRVGGRSRRLPASGGKRGRPRPRARRRGSRRRRPKRLNGVASLRLDVERLAARDEHLRVGRAADQRRHRRRGLDDLLEIVEEHEQALACDVVDQAVVGTDGRPDRPLDEQRDRGRLGAEPRRRRRETARPSGGELQREPRLAAPPGPVSVTRRLERMRSPASASSRRRPTSGVAWIGRFVRYSVRSGGKSPVAQLEEPVRDAEVLEAVLAEVDHVLVPREAAGWSPRPGPAHRGPRS